MRGETRMRMRDPNATRRAHSLALELTRMHLDTRTVMTNTKFQTQYQNQYQPQTWVASQQRLDTGVCGIKKKKKKKKKRKAEKGKRKKGAREGESYHEFLNANNG
jgi:hypothetical protein